MTEKKLVGEAIVNCGKTHSQKIMPQIEALLNSLELKPADIDCFAVAAGPGSFTGVRIGNGNDKKRWRMLRENRAQRFQRLKRWPITFHTLTG